MKKEKKRKVKKEKSRLGLRAILKAPLPPAIMSRITPLMTTGLGLILASFILIFIKPIRTTAPFFAMLGLVIIGFAIWQKRDALTKGYDEYIFKVVDYTYISPIVTKFNHPTGMLLLKKEEDSAVGNNIYHVATSGKTRNLPPIDWLIRVYVPKGSEAVPYGDRKYFPVVYGYAIEGEDSQ